ncbi:MAG: imidazole glycerol phosphate synthase subunit HisH [Tannerella sp.]|jgi:glutamine amidotransferase|nr:imidazole glycerol phosphate synthase subunit HisH [Tannerella sp.]
MKVAIIKYNAGNIRSVDYGLRRRGVTPLITDDVEIIRSCDKVVLPGQGEAGVTMAYLKEKGLDVLIKTLRQPVLGICIGMQILCSRSEESGGTQCLGIFEAEVKKFVAQKHEDKIPHTGWNSLSDMKGEIFTDISDNQYAYFVHSYYIPVNNNTVATCNYILPFSAAMQKNNFYATQFHPEKSGSAGEIILENFIKL